MKCVRCKSKLKELPTGGYDNALRIRIEGGYAEFIDDIVLSRQQMAKYPYFLILCHSCGHQLMDWLTVPKSDIKKWHPLDPNEPLCEGWTFPHSPSSE